MDRTRIPLMSLPWQSDSLLPAPSGKPRGSLCYTGNPCCLSILCTVDYFFVCGPFLKPLLNLSPYGFYFMFWIFGTEARGILAPRPQMEPVPPESWPLLQRVPHGRHELGKQNWTTLATAFVIPENKKGQESLHLN